MSELIAKAIGEAASSLIEAGVRYLFTRMTPTEPPRDPVSEAQEAVEGFLGALRGRDGGTLAAWCEPNWLDDPDTTALLDEAINAAPPISWTIGDVYGPEGWSGRTPLPWLVCDVVVTFDLGGTYETIPAVLRSQWTGEQWLISHLEWGIASPSSSSEEPVELAEEVVDLSGFDFPDIFQQPYLGPSVILCAGCERKLSVPNDKGRLRVTCPTCKNVQWFEP